MTTRTGSTRTGRAAPAFTEADTRVIGVDEAPDAHEVAAAAIRWLRLLESDADAHTVVLPAADLVDGYTVELVAPAGSARLVVALDASADVAPGMLSASTEHPDGPASLAAGRALRLAFSELLGGDAGFHRFPDGFDAQRHSRRVLASAFGATPS